MKIITLFIKDFIEKTARYAYRFFRLMQAEKGKNLFIKFPVKVEGSGKLIFGENCKIDKNTYFACGKNYEFVNDVPYRTGEPNNIYFGKIDTVFNILSNKLSTIVNRDEPKDMFDIMHIALNYKFNWKTVFFETEEKNIINEIDVEQRINTFPVELFDNVDWFVQKPDYPTIKKYIKTIADDFITGSDNSLSKTNINIADAKPIIL